MMKVEYTKSFIETIGSIDVDIEEALKEQQKKREFKDAGKRVRGSRKEEALYKSYIKSSDLKSIELDESTAVELVKKDKVFAKIDVERQKEYGVTAGCAYLKSKIRSAFPAKPKTNTTEARREYVEMAEAIQSVLADACLVYDLNALFALATNGEIIPRTDFKLIFGSQLRNLIFAIHGYSGTGNAPKIVSDAKRYEGINTEDANVRHKKLTDYFDKRIGRIQTCVDTLNFLTTNRDVVKHKVSLFFKGGMLSSYHEPITYSNYVKEVADQFIAKEKGILHKQASEYPYQKTDPDWTWADAKKGVKKTTSSSKIENTPLHYIKRTGGLLISDVDENTVIEKLNFKSLTLGNYVKDVEAKEHIRHFVSSITDLCDVLNINLKVNSNLAIGFGAFGRGGKAMATYYPNKQLINLTKRAGDGSVAHEWGHFFDHLANGLSFDGLSSEVIIREVNEKLGRRKKYFVNSSSVPTSSYFIDILDDVATRVALPGTLKSDFVALVLMIRYSYYHKDKRAVTQSAMTDSEVREIGKRVTNSNLFHYSKRQGTYWSSIEEMVARSFECYVFDKLKDQGRENNYLVSGEHFSVPVYPQSYERKFINMAFDTLFDNFRKEQGEFVPFTKERADEYISLSEKGSVSAGVVKKKTNKRVKTTKEKLAEAIAIAMNMKLSLINL